MKQFAKLFGPDEDQILVKLDQSPDDSSPEVRVYFYAPIEGLAICSMAYHFDNNEEGWNKAEKLFRGLDEPRVREAIGRFAAKLRKVMKRKK